MRETLLRLNRQLEDVLEAAQKDPLTGLYNRAYFESAVRRRVEFAHRRTDTVAVALIDVDRFKEVNDTQGHGMGDLALQQIARLLASQGRETDVIARYGGDEFSLLMPGTSAEAALIVADRIRHLVEAQNVAGIPLTLSIGIATCPMDATSLPALIELADEAMYRAKDAGGNAVRRYARAGGGTPSLLRAHRCLTSGPAGQSPAGSLGPRPPERRRRSVGIAPTPKAIISTCRHQAPPSSPKTRNCSPPMSNSSAEARRGRRSILEHLTTQVSRIIAEGVAQGEFRVRRPSGDWPGRAWPRRTLS